ncbi:hypothetical protein TOPH_09155 [Tolypocladium ophioglossoides CBS 100239]|uniref:Uncharacterized protein n=1 Tax=Tolypocladium ophioglossoides (strain CBS 100239) TaxID=1163406 RepID=A0A0L0MWG6_TOLOC|nr:hypothetical protein TOPH_09155 [Tolypocladium ophioglossoides CBS 100239]
MERYLAETPLALGEDKLTYVIHWPAKQTTGLGRGKAPSASLRSAACINNLDTIVAEDDGGICEMLRENTGWAMQSPYLACLEAKRAFKYLHIDDKSEEVRPVVSNETLAQCFGEAIITWTAKRKSMGQELLPRSVFLIAAASTFLRFLHCHFGSHYAELVDATEGEDQKALIADSEKDTYVYMQSSKWLNLQSTRGRRIALCHVLALLRWHDEHESSSERASIDGDISMEGGDGE